MDIKVITAQMCLNFASFLYENSYFEDCFQVYEKSVALFIFPQVKVIWLSYMDKFMERYEGTKLERLRDIFEQSLVSVPPEDTAEFYYQQHHHHHPQQQQHHQLGGAASTNIVSSSGGGYEKIDEAGELIAPLLTE